MLNYFSNIRAIFSFSTVLLVACTPEKPQQLAPDKIKTIPITYKVDYVSDANIPISYRGVFMRSLQRDLSSPSLSRNFELASIDDNNANLSISFYRAQKVNYPVTTMWSVSDYLLKNKKIKERNIDPNCRSEIQLHSRVQIFNNSKNKIDTIVVTNVPIQQQHCTLEGFSNADVQGVNGAMAQHAYKVGSLVRSAGGFY